MTWKEFETLKTYYSDHKGNINDFWAYAQEVLVEPDEKAKEKRFVFALCNRGGVFEEMIVLRQSEIIVEDTDENDDGTYYLEFQTNNEADNAYFLSKEEI